MDYEPTSPVVTLFVGVFMLAALLSSFKKYMNGEKISADRNFDTFLLVAGTVVTLFLIVYSIVQMVLHPGLIL